MANTSRHIDLAVEDALETREEAQRLINLIDAALEDGQVSLDEALAIQRQAREVERESNEDVLAVERANVAELVMASNLKEGRVSPYLLKRARDVGLDVAQPIVVLSNVPATEKVTA